MTILISNHFKKQIKPYAKKYANLLDNTINALKTFDKNNAIHLGHHVYKIRLKSSDLRKGKSGGFRLIILLVETDNLITPVVLYFKGGVKQIFLKKKSLIILT